MKFDRTKIEELLEMGRCPIHNIVMLYQETESKTLEIKKEVVSCPTKKCSVKAIRFVDQLAIFPEPACKGFEICDGPDELIDAFMGCHDNEIKKVEWRLTHASNPACKLIMEGVTYNITVFKSKFGSFSVCISNPSNKPEYKNGFSSTEEAKNFVDDLYLTMQKAKYDR